MPIPSHQPKNDPVADLAPRRTTTQPTSLSNEYQSLPEHQQNEEGIHNAGTGIHPNFGLPIRRDDSLFTLLGSPNLFPPFPEAMNIAGIPSGPLNRQQLRAIISEAIAIADEFEADLNAAETVMLNDYNNSFSSYPLRSGPANSRSRQNRNGSQHNRDTFDRLPQ